MIILATHIRRLQQALALCKQVPSDQVFRLGCVIFNGGGSPIGSGVNAMTKTHPKAVRIYDFPYPHAEFMATHNVASAKLRGSIAYVARELRGSKEPAMAKPCGCCIDYLKERGVKRVYFTTDEGADCIDLR